MLGPIQVSDEENIRRMIMACVKLGCLWRIPFYRAAANGLINVLELPRGISRAETNAAIGLIKTPDRPCILLLGDDDYASSGPAGWYKIRRLFAWAESIWVHSAKGDESHYAAAVVHALRTNRLLFIETSSECGHLWLALAPRTKARCAFISADQHPLTPIQH